MIHLPTKNRDQPPPRLSVHDALRQIERAILNADGNIYNHSFYPDNTVVEKLKAYSLHKIELEEGDLAKCYYCESKISHGATLQVEHFRPKAKVEAGENDHLELPGYYWLGLEWTNLLLSCPKCNGKDAKGNKFPITGVRAQPLNPLTIVDGALTLSRANCFAHEGLLHDELPVLLNPEVDRPEEYLTFDLMANFNGHGPEASRGEISKHIYRLNRDELLWERQKVWNEIKNLMNIYIHSFQANLIDENALRHFLKIIVKDMLKRKQPTEEFSLWGTYINEHRQDFLDAEIDPQFHELFNEVYHEVSAVEQMII